jgi:predicted 2-oxoglutarate/Fe(II)-dependent dioxygenase YbiX
MGLHNDNDVNYQPGFEPDLQIATRSVVSSIMYFNSSVESAYDIKQNEYVGGEIEFPYLGVKYSPKAGDLLIFPSNYLATHEVKQCFHGSRYAYVGYYSQGSRQIDRGITVQDQTLSVGKQGQVWMPEIIEQYKNHIFNKHKNSNKETLDRLLQPTARMFNSANTQEELS